MELITLQYCSGFCHTLTWIHHGGTCVPHPESPSHLPPHPIPQDHPSAPAPSALSHASNLDWRSISHMVIYMFHCHSPRSSHPHPLPQSPRDCSVHLCLFCCLALIFVLIHLFVVLGLHLLLTVLNISKRKKGRAEERKKEEFFFLFPFYFSFWYSESRKELFY